MWANEFVREELWGAATWRAEQLHDAKIDASLANRMAAQLDVRTKCRNNYRHMFQLCGFWPAELPVINTGTESWIGSALFLAWDRHALDGGSTAKTELVAVVSRDELHKLLGISRQETLNKASALADLYIAAGGPARIGNASAPATQNVEIPEETGTGWIDQEGSDEVVQRQLVTRQEQKRDRRKAAALKERYENRCMFCGVKVQVAEDSYYSEAAHIRPLGSPHDGPDKVSNMIILCPNHHLQFDRGMLRMRWDGKSYRLVSKVSGDPLDGSAVPTVHRLDPDCVEYHWKWFDLARP